MSLLTRAAQTAIRFLAFLLACFASTFTPTAIALGSPIGETVYIGYDAAVAYDGSQNSSSAYEDAARPPTADEKHTSGAARTFLSRITDLLAAETTMTSSVAELRAAGLKDAHHVIQDAAVRDLPGYSSRSAPGVQLAGPSTEQGTPHYIATQVQRQAGGGTYGAERRIGYKALRQAGYSEIEARQIIGETDAYFESIGVTPSTPTRIPGNRN